MISWLTGLAIVGFTAASWLVDRASLPAYQQARRWKLVCLGLLGTLWLVSTKALLWHQELILLIPNCQ